MNQGWWEFQELCFKWGGKGGTEKQGQGGMNLRDVGKE